MEDFGGARSVLFGEEFSNNRRGLSTVTKAGKGIENLATDRGVDGLWPKGGNRFVSIRLFCGTADERALGRRKDRGRAVWQEVVQRLERLFAAKRGEGLGCQRGDGGIWRGQPRGECGNGGGISARGERVHETERPRWLVCFFKSLQERRGCGRVWIVLQSAAGSFPNEGRGIGEQGTETGHRGGGGEEGQLPQGAEARRLRGRRVRGECQKVFFQSGCGGRVSSGFSGLKGELAELCFRLEAFRQIGRGEVFEDIPRNGCLCGQGGGEEESGEKVFHKCG